MFLTAAGDGTGNILDYYSDVSYGAISLANTTVRGWYPAPFNGTEPGLAGSGNRYRRAQSCADAIPSPEAAGIAFGSYWGIIVVTNLVQDGGACYDGQQPLVIQGSSYNLACIIFDPNSLYTAFAAHEVGHGLGLPHSYNDTQNICANGGKPGEYCDPWDIMSALVTYRFFWPNYSDGDAGPGANIPNLLNLKVIPQPRIRTYQVGSPAQTLIIRALSHPIGNEPLTIKIVGIDNDPNNAYMVEYRQADGWDTGFRVSAVLIHRYKIGANPYSFLQENTEPNPGGWLPNDSWDDSTGQVQVHVNSIDTSAGTASVTVGAPPPANCFVWILTCGHQASMLCNPTPHTLVLQARLANAQPPAPWLTAGSSPGTPQNPAYFIYDSTIAPEDNEFQACVVLDQSGRQSCVAVPHSTEDQAGCPGGPPKPPPPSPGQCMKQGCKPSPRGGCLCQ